MFCAADVEDKGLETRDREFCPGSSRGPRDSFFQKRGLAQNIEDGLPPSERAESDVSLGFPPPLRAKLPQDVEQAVSSLARTPAAEAPNLWSDTFRKETERSRTPGGTSM